MGKNEMTPNDKQMQFDCMKQLAQEATDYAITLGKMIEALKCFNTTIPHVLSLDEAKALSPHTAIWAEYNPSGAVTGPYEMGEGVSQDKWWDEEYNHSVRWWNIWPLPELRMAIPWKEASK